MGSTPSELGRGRFDEDQVQVKLTHAFQIQRYELTQDQWTRLCLHNPSGLMVNGTGDCLGARCPVDNVNWFEALAFANLLSAAQSPALTPCYVLQGCTGDIGRGMKCNGVDVTAATIYDCAGFRLPTEAEWEYVARAGTTTAFYSGDIAPIGNPNDCTPDPNLQRIGWYCQNAGTRTKEVGQLTPNAWGLYDMSGNVDEWVMDRYNGLGYGPGPLTDPGGLVGDVSSLRVFRGGSFNSWSSLCRSANRLAASPGGPGGTGLRLVRPAAKPLGGE